MTAAPNNTPLPVRDREGRFFLFNCLLQPRQIDRAKFVDFRPEGAVELGVEILIGGENADLDDGGGCCSAP